MLKVIVACGCGMGSSQMMKMSAQTVFKEMNIAVQIHHTSVDEAMSSANDYDVIIVSDALVRNFKNCKKTVIGLKNIMSKAEMRIKFKEANLSE